MSQCECNQPDVVGQYAWRECRIALYHHVPHSLHICWHSISCGKDLNKTSSLQFCQMWAVCQLSMVARLIRLYKVDEHVISCVLINTLLQQWYIGTSFPFHVGHYITLSSASFLLAFRLLRLAMYRDKVKLLPFVYTGALIAYGIKFNWSVMLHAWACPEKAVRAQHLILPICFKVRYLVILLRPFCHICLSILLTRIVMPDIEWNLQNGNNGANENTTILKVATTAPERIFYRALMASPMETCLWPNHLPSLFPAWDSGHAWCVGQGQRRQRKGSCWAVLVVSRARAMLMMRFVTYIKVDACHYLSIMGSHLINQINLWIFHVIHKLLWSHCVCHIWNTTVACCLAICKLQNVSILQRADVELGL